jgi:hypothetical protein
VAHTPEEIEAVLEQMRAELLRWQREGILGEVVCVVGEHLYQPEARPRLKLRGVKREQAGRQPIVRTG